MTEIFKEAMELQQAGYNCAETVVTMAERYYLPKMPAPYMSFVTGFGGGIGRCRDEVCGALSGAVLVLSVLFGRSDINVDVDPIHEIIRGFREVFLSEFKESVCGKLREGLESEDAKKMCHELTAKTVELLFIYLEKNGAEIKA